MPLYVLFVNLVLFVPSELCNLLKVHDGHLRDEDGLLILILILLVDDLCYFESYSRCTSLMVSMVCTKLLCYR